MSTTLFGTRPMTMASIDEVVRQAEAACESNAAARMFVLVSTPLRFEIGVLVLGKIMVFRDGDTEPVAVERNNAYELRFFGEEGDFQWRRTDASKGSLVAVVRQDAPERSSRQGDHPDTKKSDSKTFDRNYLLWGEVESVRSAGGIAWAKCMSSRTHPFWVPISDQQRQMLESDSAKKKCLQLQAVEHIERGIDGNAFVAFERLTGFAVHDPLTQQEE